MTIGTQKSLAQDCGGGIISCDMMEGNKEHFCQPREKTPGPDI